MVLHLLYLRLYSWHVLPLGQGVALRHHEILVARCTRNSRVPVRQAPSFSRTSMHGISLHSLASVGRLDTLVRRRKARRQRKCPTPALACCFWTIARPICLPIRSITLVSSLRVFSYEFRGRTKRISDEKGQRTKKGPPTIGEIGPKYGKMVPEEGLFKKNAVIFTIIFFTFTCLRLN